MKTLTTLFTLLLVLSYAPAVTAQTYVDHSASGNNDGSSWADAYTELATALDNYSPGDEIWVAAGTYLPQQLSAWTGDPRQTFYLYQDLKLYGGFAGTETMLSERDPAAHVTILSGDLNGDDVDDDFATNRDDNVINVVYVDTVISNATIIDGFTVSGGHADGGEYNLAVGGGLFSLGSPQTSHCRFTQNYADTLAAGLLLRGRAASEAVITDCLFDRNRSNQTGRGLGLFGLDSSRVVQISRCQFSENRATRVGGGMAVGSASFALTDCAFSANTSGLWGGGILVQPVTNEGQGFFQATLLNCDFVDNLSGRGGAYYGLTTGLGDNNLVVDSCTFTNNRAADTLLTTFGLGGAMAFSYAIDAPSHDSISITNSTFLQNSAANAGGAVFFSQFDGTQHGELLIADCEFTDNASFNGGAVYLESTAVGNNTTALTNCDFRNNQVAGTLPGRSASGGAIDIGYFGDGPTRDSILIADCQFRENAAELRGGGIAFRNEAGRDNFFSVSNSEFVQDTAGREGGGIYITNLVFATANQFDLLDCRFEGSTALSGGGMKYNSAGRGGNRLRITGTDWIDNRSITNADGDTGAGGLFLNYPAGTLSRNDTVRISDCLFQGNTSALNAGGLGYTHFGRGANYLEVLDCAFVGNETESSNAVGGLGITEGGSTYSVRLENTHFRANVGPATAAFGVTSSSSEPAAGRIELTSCLFTEHNDASATSAVLNTNRAFSLINSTVADNQSPALRITASGSVTLQNTIFATKGGGANLLTEGQTGVPINSLGGNLSNDTTLDAYLNATDQSDTDPLFEAGTFQLSLNSPAVDAGVLPDAPTATDLAGNPRIQGSCIDIGAYESPYDAGVTACLVVNIREVLAAPSALRIFPNPTAGPAQIAIENEWSGELEIRIVNALGQVVHRSTSEQYTEEILVEVDTGNLPKGLYRVLVSDGRVMAVGSFVRL